MTEEDLLEGIIRDPASAAATWLVLADWLEERDDPRAELIRLRRDPNFRPELSPVQRDERLTELLRAGVRPCVPIRTVPTQMKLVFLEPGTFMMGSPETEAGRREEEGPLHAVTITRPFFMGVYPVTVSQFLEFVTRTGYQTEAEQGEGAYRWVAEEWVRDRTTSWLDPGFEQRDDCPVTCVSWNDARQFCHFLYQNDPAHYYRLPTEAEWEYACRAGTTTAFHCGNSLGSDLANCDGESPYGDAPRGTFLARTTPVGSYPPNSFGLFDMHGNVYELCADRWDQGFYASSRGQDPAGPQDGFEWVIWFDCNFLGREPQPPARETGTLRVHRGGAWLADATYCRSAYRAPGDSTQSVSTRGFRVVAIPRK
jgi:uncharacterized protein (TIGR02996 family)